jgi:c-di-GMP-binding flagellar brake protein YcgR
VGGNGSGQKKAVTSDISQGGMSLKLSRRAQKPGPMRVKFTLPGTDHDIECEAEVAWEGDGSQAGIRFANLSPEQRDRLKVWLARHAPEMEVDDPPAPCQLTDISSGGCYLEMAAPFPTNTRVILIMRLAKLESRVEGVVRVMHPEIGMGVEFTRTTNQQRKDLEEFIHALKNHKGARPELVVEPEGMNDAEPVGLPASTIDDIEDPLLELFQRNTDFSTESFRSELRKQRNSSPAVAQAVAAGSC